MISRSDSKSQATETPDEAVLDMTYRHSVSQLSDAHHTDDNNRLTGACMLCTEDENLINDSIISNKMLLLKEPCFSFLDQDYVEKIKEFQCFVDMVKKIVRPGCSPEMLNVALSSMSSLVKTLSVISSKRYRHALL
ncbi:hypothetical protein Pfo_005656 [Paulownia fortunei]|nr:hypothetical protein Pfo_005656 [Paulownia fortunei]